MKNKYEIRGDVTAIFIKSPKYGMLEALISTSMLQHVRNFKTSWHVNVQERKKTFYVHGSIPKEPGKKIKLHRWITEATNGMQVDHLNNNGLDNTNENLRIVTHAENMQNKSGARIDNGTSKIRGVYWNKESNKWCSQLMLKGKHIHLGLFEDISEAENVVKEARARLMPFSKEAFAK